MGNSLCRMWLAVPVHLSKFLSSEDPSNMLRILVFGKSRVFLLFFFFYFSLACSSEGVQWERQTRQEHDAGCHIAFDLREQRVGRKWACYSYGSSKFSLRLCLASSNSGSS